ncbi:molybdenum cofactor biosynthesis protein MoaE [Hippea maritima]|uniref:Molybdopterin synthase catalytic subunit n=1 Tax=Hippea maritima (strain ATCC 700847 / DSM 10411 / MH2) TaxID=760142 RepID=F2LTN9_HIPMA|nr:molybdenum cofactor biosynthesis protein MoaE [Hippea maritima]AEA33364.1 molybdopterin biosynthesis MoaE protein [Hippea maritima DSM 10411]
MVNLSEQIQNIKKQASADNLGMILVHNGVVRATSANGDKISKISIDYDDSELKTVINEFEKLKSVEKVWVWINRGMLRVGDDVMYVIVAGNKREELFPIFIDFVNRIKAIVKKEEILRR